MYSGRNYREGDQYHQYPKSRFSVKIGFQFLGTLNAYYFVTWDIQRAKNMHVFFIFIFTLSTAFSHTDLEETIEFDIQRGKKVVGELVAQRVTRGNKTVYTSYTKASIAMIKRVTMVYEFKVTMKDGALFHADTKVIMNKKLHATSKVRLEKAQYHFLKNNIKGYNEAYIDYPIDYPAILLLFDEPKTFNASFSEEEGIFHDLERVADHVYHKTNPKGKVNEYHYQDGMLSKATLDAGIFQFRVVRKEEHM
jgi:hypothetical protein